MSDQQPLNPAGNGDGRGPNGRFATGNKAGKGNPLNAKAQRIRAELLRAATRPDVKAIVQRLMEGAKSGDLQFIREWLDRVIGKPAQSELLERVEALESLMNERKSK